MILWLRKFLAEYSRAKSRTSAFIGAINLRGFSWRDASVTGCSCPFCGRFVITVQRLIETPNPGDGPSAITEENVGWFCLVCHVGIRDWCRGPNGWLPATDLLDTQL